VTTTVTVSTVTGAIRAVAATVGAVIATICRIAAVVCGIAATVGAVAVATAAVVRPGAIGGGTNRSCSTKHGSATIAASSYARDRMTDATNTTISNTSISFGHCERN